MTPREEAERFGAPKLAALAALPWIRTADMLPKWAAMTNARFLVLVAPSAGDTGSKPASLEVVFYGDKGFQCPGTVLAWLDLRHCPLDDLAQILQQP